MDKIVCKNCSEPVYKAKDDWKHVKTGSYSCWLYAQPKWPNRRLTVSTGSEFPPPKRKVSKPGGRNLDKEKSHFEELKAWWSSPLPRHISPPQDETGRNG